MSDVKVVYSSQFSVNGFDLEVRPYTNKAGRSSAAIFLHLDNGVEEIDKYLAPSEFFMYSRLFGVPQDQMVPIKNAITECRTWIAENVPPAKVVESKITKGD